MKYTFHFYSYLPAVIKISALQVMYCKDAFKPLALPYGLGTKVKQEDTALV